MSSLVPKSCPDNWDWQGRALCMNTLNQYTNQCTAHCHWGDTIKCCMVIYCAGTGHNTLHANVGTILFMINNLYNKRLKFCFLFAADLNNEDIICIFGHTLFSFINKLSAPKVIIKLLLCFNALYNALVVLGRLGSMECIIFCIKCKENSLNVL